MAYATLADMVTAYGNTELVQITSRSTPTPGQIDAAAVERALRDAEGRVDAYLADRYAVPLTVVPDVIRRATCEIARFYLSGTNAGEAVGKAYDREVRFLAEIAAGRAALAGVASAPSAAPGGGAGVVSIDGPPRVFSRDSLQGF